MSDRSAKPGFFAHIPARHADAVAEAFVQVENVLDQLTQLQKSFLEKAPAEAGGREQKTQRDWLAVGRFEKGDAFNEWVDRAAQRWEPRDWVAHFDALRALEKETDRILLEKKARAHRCTLNCSSALRRTLARRHYAPLCMCSPRALSPCLRCRVQASLLTRTDACLQVPLPPPGAEGRRPCLTVSFAPAKKKLDEKLRHVGQALASGVARLAKKDRARIDAFLDECGAFFSATQKTAEEIGQARVAARQLTERLWEMKAAAKQVADKRELLAWMGGRDPLVEEDLAERLDAALSRLQGFEGDIQKKVDSLKGEWEDKARGAEVLSSRAGFPGAAAPLVVLLPAESPRADWAGPASRLTPSPRRRERCSSGPSRSRAAGSSSAAPSEPPRVRCVPGCSSRPPLAPTLPLR